MYNVRGHTHARSGQLQYNLTNDKASSSTSQLPCNKWEWHGPYKNVTLTKNKCYEAFSQAEEGPLPAKAGSGLGTIKGTGKEGLCCCSDFAAIVCILFLAYS